MTESRYRLPRCWVAVGGIVILGLAGACGQTTPVGADSPVARVGRCPVFGFDTAAPRLSATIALDSDTVSAGSTFSGTVTFTNPGEDIVYFPYNGSSVVAPLFSQG
ncbi:MAG: hypothetical protein U9N84_13660, partial [Actinomycetota bacterium]|nr:hypothetical protein [Actinomycetota bacterium]